MLPADHEGYNVIKIVSLLQRLYFVVSKTIAQEHFDTAFKTTATQAALDNPTKQCTWLYTVIISGVADEEICDGILFDEVESLLLC